jgi:hypothetical protein
MLVTDVPGHVLWLKVFVLEHFLTIKQLQLYAITCSLNCYILNVKYVIINPQPMKIRPVFT